MRSWASAVGGDEEVGHLATALVSGGEEALNLLGSADVLRGGVDEVEGFDSNEEFIPLGRLFLLLRERAENLSAG